MVYACGPGGKGSETMIRRWVAAAAVLGWLVPAAEAQQQTVSVQLVRSIAQAPFYIAVGKGYFEAEGLKVEAGDVRSALDTIGPLATGRLDASIGAATAGFFNAAHQGFDLRVVAAMGIQGPVMATQPLIRKALWDAGTIRSGKDYKGRKIAINAPGDVTEFFLTLIAEKYGMKLADMNVTPLAFAAQLIGFKTGAIDAGWLPEPLSTSAQMAGSVMLNTADEGVGEGILTTFVFYGTKFMHDRPKVALAFMRALVRGAREAHGAYLKNPEIAASIAKQTGIKLEAVEHSTPYFIDPNLDIAKYEAGLRRLETVHRANGRINYKEPLDFKTVIDASVVHEAAAGVK
jgi:NitT/TauT family transport system substrate-binding protein